MLRGVGDIVQLLTGLLPPWAVALVVGAVLVAALPAWIRSGKSKRIRGDVRRMVRAEAGRRDRLEGDVLDRAGRDKHLLELTVKEARRREMRSLAERAMERLRGLPGADPFVARLQADPPPKQPEKRWGHPIEAAAAIHTLIENGATAAAAERLAEVRARFPDDDELRALASRLERVDVVEGG